ncbi:MAG TPA: hydroxymethylglutaryl-CoA synthase [Vicinamibacteria bacterium]
MKPVHPVGILGFGAYVPRLRLAGADIAAVWKTAGGAPPPVAEKAVAGADEDVVTMSIEASRTALARARVGAGQVGALWVGTASKPYAIKPAASMVAEALGLTPRLVAADVEFGCKSGSDAMQAALAFVGSGMVEAALAVGMDVAPSRPGDALEYTAAAGGAAFVFGAAERVEGGAVALVEASLSYVTDTPDFFRRDGAAHPRHGGRFGGEPAYFAHTLAASRALLEELGARPADFAHAVFHQPFPKFVEKAGRDLGFTPAQLRAGLVAPRLGNAYAGSSLLGLAAVLDVAAPGERIFLCSYGSGAGSDAFALRATGALPERRSGPTVAQYLDRARRVAGYGEYLKLSGGVRR